MYLRRIFFSIVFVLTQSSPEGLGLMWNGTPVDTLVQGDCYDLIAGPNAAGMTLDIVWSVNGGPPQSIDGWPTLDGNGQAANICTSMDTPVGVITFEAIRNSAGGPWVSVGYELNILPQATGAAFNGLSGYAGVDSYIFSVSGLQGRDVHVRYDHGGSHDVQGIVSVDAAGNYSSGIFDHYSYWGEYVITGVQDAAAQPGNWVGVHAPYTILPPQPQSLSTTPATVVAGAANGTQLYRLSAINGGGMALSLRYGILNQGQWIWGSESSWPWLNATGPSGWDWISDYISTAKCTRPGGYHFYQVKNSIHGDNDWKDIDTWLTVTGSGAPSLSSISPVAANRDQILTVTIHGQELCGITQLQSSYPGLSFSNIDNPDWSDGTSFTARFTIAANAAPGNALITIPTRGGNTSFQFEITQGAALPTIAGIAPSSAPPGSTLSVTLTGTNLVNPVLSTTWSGLTFSNVVPNANGTSLTATFSISGSAATGNPVVRVTTASGFALTALFSISAPIASPAVSREYIYFGDRVIAVDSP